MFDFTPLLYRDEDEALYQDAMGQNYVLDKEGAERDAEGKRRYYRDWRTYQMSDHLPMWIELGIDFSRQYLAYKRDQNA